MTAMVWWLVGIATVLAVIDWTAVVKQSRPIEMFAKPATMLALAPLRSPRVPSTMGSISG
jgi:hypothetical protein